MRAGDCTILFDLGLNRAGSAEPPLLRNMARLGIAPAAVDAIVVSHAHGDHLGGFGNQFHRRAIVSRGRDGADSFVGRPVYAPVPLLVTAGQSVLVDGPRILSPAIATTGPLPCALYFLGFTLEQALAVHVAEKGIVLIVGCGHPGITAYVERARQVFGLPVYGVIGGLHLPITDDRVRIGPMRMQRLPGSAEPPWRPPRKADAYRVAASLKHQGVRYVAPSAHDTCDWTLDLLADEFAAGYARLRVGEELRLEAVSAGRPGNTTDGAETSARTTDGDDLERGVRVAPVCAGQQASRKGWP